MNLSFLILRDFRNYDYLELPLYEGVNLFYGRNAQGKTNLLEACYYLSTLTSPRAEKERDLPSWGKDRFSLAGKIKKGEKVDRLRVEVDTAQGVRKKVFVNGVSVKRNEIQGIFPCVYFSPDDLYMVKSSSSMRRRFLDLLLSRVDGEYSREISRYNQGVSRRNQALKKVPFNPTWKKVLDGLDELVVESGSQILLKRQLLMEKFVPRVRDVYRFISGKECNLSYISSLGDIEPQKEVIREKYKKAMAHVYPKEIQRGVTLIGPHRDDLEILFGDKSFRYFGSQGEQRSVALALRLAEASTLEENFGRKSALLLDDVLSELDETRREKVLSLESYGHQIFITSTDRVAHLEDRCKTFRVADKGVYPLEMVDDI